jgi:hypothetical protein
MAEFEIEEKSEAEAALLQGNFQSPISAEDLDD